MPLPEAGRTKQVLNDASFFPAWSLGRGVSFIAGDERGFSAWINDSSADAWGLKSQGQPREAALGKELVMFVSTLHRDGKSSRLVYVVEDWRKKQVLVLLEVRLAGDSPLSRVRLGSAGTPFLRSFRAGSAKDPWARYEAAMAAQGWTIVHEPSAVCEALRTAFGAPPAAEAVA